MAGWKCIDGRDNTAKRGRNTLKIHVQVPGHTWTHFTRGRAQWHCERRACLQDSKAQLSVRRCLFRAEHDRLSHEGRHRSPKRDTTFLSQTEIQGWRQIV
jgi:hypothetical protein